MKRKKTYAQLKRELDRVFSLWVRWKDADQKGVGTCFTCGIRKSWRLLQCGHFIPRNCLALRWSEYNCRPQCVSCNVFKRGNYQEFAFRLGQATVGALLMQKHRTVKFTRDDLQQMIADFSRFSRT